MEKSTRLWLPALAWSLTCFGKAEQPIPPPPPQADLSVSEAKLESASYNTYDIEVINLLLQIKMYNVAN